MNLPDPGAIMARRPAGRAPERQEESLPTADQTEPSRGALLFAPVRTGRPADEIVAQVRRHLSEGKLRAGDRLPSERELASQFGVSRNSVRQALRSLAEVGLFEMRKGALGGAFVREGGGEAVSAGLSDLYALGSISPEHLTEVRLLIGVETVRLAAMRWSAGELEALERNVEAAERAADADDREARMRLNLEFHGMLARMTRNPILITLTEAVGGITERFVRDIGGPSTNDYVMPLRRKLLRHLWARDVEAATREMRDHLLTLQEHYLATASSSLSRRMRR